MIIASTFLLLFCACMCGYALVNALKVLGQREASIREKIARDNSRSLNDPGRLLR